MDKIKKIEDYAKSIVIMQAGHGYDHTNRVRNWGLIISEQEDYPRPDLVQAAALLHDIGLSKAGDRRDHGLRSAEMAEIFFTENNLFGEEDIAEIYEAISTHNKGYGGRNFLSAILKDADILDLLGPIGVLRAARAELDLPYYLTEDIKSPGWKKGNDYFDLKFQSGRRPADDMMEQFCFQASCYENMKLKSAKAIAKPYVDFLYDFIIKLDKQIGSVISERIKDV